MQNLFQNGANDISEMVNIISKFFVKKIQILCSSDHPIKQDLIVRTQCWNLASVRDFILGTHCGRIFLNEILFDISLEYHRSKEDIYIIIYISNIDAVNRGLYQHLITLSIANWELRSIFRVFWYSFLRKPIIL